MAEPADAQLVRRCQAGDKAAFSLLVIRHQMRLRRLLLATLRHPADADDVLQETFLRAYLGIESLRRPERFRAWVCAIALNLARMWQRSLVRRPILDGDLDLWAAATADTNPSPEQAFEQRETAQRLAEALADLPPSERNALLLVYRDGLSHQETAARLGASLSAVKVRVHRGRRRLRAALAPTKPIDQYTNRPEEVNMIPVAIHNVLANSSPLDPRPLLEPHFAALAGANLEQLWPAIGLTLTERRPFLLDPFCSGELVADLSPEERELFQDTIHRFRQLRIVLLKEHSGERALPIWIGPCEGDAIVVRLQNQALKRPLSFDLIIILLGLGNLQVTQVAISRLHETVFYATLSVQIQGEAAEVDCRPSDALSLAVRLDAPIYVAPDVMDEAGVMPDEDGRYPVGRERGSNVEWYSLLH
jgi:RNA polymerase sigma factor (sigma-70 family)